MTEPARVPPHNLEAEESLLGAMMLSRDAIRAAEQQHITAGDFYKPTLGMIYSAAMTLHTRGAGVDPVTIAEELRRGGQLDNAGGRQNLLRIQAATPASANAQYYAQIVAELAQHRRIQVAAHIVVDAGQSADTETVASAIRELISVSEPPPSPEDRYVTGASFVRDSARDVPAVWGIDDRVLWARGESLLLVGPPGVGKTTVAAQLLAASIGYLEAVIDLPIAPCEHVLYLACDRPAQIGRAFMRLMPDATDAQLARLTIWKGPPEHLFGVDPQALVAMCHDVGADRVFIDSLKDVAPGLSDDVIGNNLNLAIQYCVAAEIDVVGLHHQRKGQAGQKPKTLEDVYGSTWITAGAGSVVLLWGNAGDPVVELTHLKQPAAEVGPLQVDHDHNTGRTTVFRGDVDPFRVLRQAPGGMTAHDLAVIQTGKESPGDNAHKKAKRTLDKLVFKSLAHKEEGGAASGSRGARPDRYFAVAGEPDRPMLDLAAVEAEDLAVAKVF